MNNPCKDITIPEPGVHYRKEQTKAINLLKQAEDIMHTCDMPSLYQKTKTIRIALETLSKESTSAQESIVKVLLDKPDFSRTKHKLVIVHSKKTLKYTPSIIKIDEQDYTHVCAFIIQINTPRQSSNAFLIKDMINEVILEPSIDISKPSEIYHILALLLIKQQIAISQIGFIYTLENVTLKTMLRVYSSLPLIPNNQHTKTLPEINDE